MLDSQTLSSAQLAGGTSASYSEATEFKSRQGSHDQCLLGFSSATPSQYRHSTSNYAEIVLCFTFIFPVHLSLTLILLTWRIWWAP